MPRFTDYTGEQLGDLQVLGYYRNKHNHILWKTRCSCGRESTFKNSEIWRYRSCKYCARRLDISNQKFGLLTAIERVRLDKNQKWVWKCKCACGNDHEATAGALRSGEVKSCGCTLLKHGLSLTPEYKAFHEAKTNSDSEFKSVDQFIAAVGFKPTPAHVLSRKDVNQPHAPNNTYWRNPYESANLTANDLGEEFSIDFRTIALSTEADGERKASEGLLPGEGEDED
jgi:hypothetical protein